MYVWDLWPAEGEFPWDQDVLCLLDPRSPDLAERYGARPVPGPGTTRPMTLYFPGNLAGLNGYWISIFGARDAASFLPPDADPLLEIPGIIYYQQYYELSEPPFRIDHFMPSAMEVPAPGTHPDATESTEGSLFPAPIRVSGPGVLPTPEQRRAAHRIVLRPGTENESDQRDR